MPQQMSTVEEVYNLVLENTEDEFLVGDLREHAPWMKSSHISAACFQLSRHGIVERHERLTGVPGRPWVWRRLATTEVPRFSRARPGYKRGFRGPREAGPAETEPDLCQDARIIKIYDRLLETVSEIEALIEGLKLENLPNADITREYHKRKEAQNAPT